MKELCAILVFILVAFVNTSPAQEKNQQKIIKIGIIQSRSHPNFDADAKGFEKALTEADFREGKGFTCQRQNAKGNRAHAEKMIERFLNAEVDLIHSIGSLASRVALKNASSLPIVFSAVTNPVDEGLVPKSSPPGTKSGTNLTGVTDHWPVQRQFNMYARFFPKAKRWGTLFNRRDPKSLLHIREMREAAKSLGLELTEATISNKVDTKEAAQSLAGKIQVMNITNDFTTLSAFDVIVTVCMEKKIPLFVGDTDKVPMGAMAAYGFNYFDIGYLAGRKAVRILKGEKPGEIPWDRVEKLSLVVNEKAAKAQGAVIPAEFLKKADKVIQE